MGRGIGSRQSGEALDSKVQRQDMGQPPGVTQPEKLATMALVGGPFDWIRPEIVDKGLIQCYNRSKPLMLIALGTVRRREW